MLIPYVYSLPDFDQTFLLANKTSYIIKVSCYEGCGFLDLFQSIEKTSSSYLHLITGAGTL